MGSRWTRYYSYEAGVLMERAWDFPRRVPAARYAQIVDRSLVFAARQYEGQLGEQPDRVRRLLVDRMVTQLRLSRIAAVAEDPQGDPITPDAAGELDLSSLEAARVLVDYFGSNATPATSRRATCTTI